MSRNFGVTVLRRIPILRGIKRGHEGIVKIDVVYVMSKINARPLRPDQQWPIFVVTYPHRPPSFGLSPREAIILNSGPAASHGMSWRSPFPPPLPVLSKRKKRHDTPKRWRRQKKCRSIYIIINRKEIYLIPRARWEEGTRYFPWTNLNRFAPWTLN